MHLAGFEPATLAQRAATDTSKHTINIIITVITIIIVIINFISSSNNKNKYSG